MKTILTLALLAWLAACQPDEAPEEPAPDPTQAEADPITAPLRLGQQIEQGLGVQKQQALDRRAQLDEMFDDSNR